VLSKLFAPVLAALAMLFGLAQQAQAAVPAGVTTAVADIGVDGSTIATTILLAVVAIFAIKFLRKGL
jgi:hypothetical protein